MAHDALIQKCLEGKIGDSFINLFFPPFIIDNDQYGVDYSFVTNKGREDAETHTESYPVPRSPLIAIASEEIIGYSLHEMWKNSIFPVKIIERMRISDAGIDALLSFGNEITRGRHNPDLPSRYEHETIDLMDLILDNAGGCSEHRLVNAIISMANQLVTSVCKLGINAEDVKLKIGCSYPLRHWLEDAKFKFDIAEAEKGSGKTLLTDWTVEHSLNERVNNKIFIALELPTALTATDKLLSTGAHVYSAGVIEKIADRLTYQSRSLLKLLLPIFGEITLTNVNEGVARYFNQILPRNDK